MSEHWLAAFVPLLDCAVLVAGREAGFLAAEGVELELVREPSWSSLRDHLSLGYVDCAHALAPLPIAAALAVGRPRVETVVPFVLGRGGNAITVSRRLYEQLVEAAGGAAPHDPGAWGRALAHVLARRSRPLTLGMVYPFSNHNFDMRYWLAASGIHPDRDLRLVAIPPPRMVESLRAGQVDGFCVGEPWNSLAVAEDVGCIVVTKSQIFPHGLEKVLAVRAAQIADSSRLDALLRGLAAAAAWCDAPGNHAELAAWLARPQYLDVDAALLEAGLGGRLALGAGRSLDDPDFVYFSRYAANAPRREEALWLYAQMLRWGQLDADAHAAAGAASVYREDLYAHALGVDAERPARAPRAFDGLAAVTDDADDYLAGFSLRTPFVQP